MIDCLAFEHTRADRLTEARLSAPYLTLKKRFSIRQFFLAL